MITTSVETYQKLFIMAVLKFAFVILPFVLNWSHAQDMADMAEDTGGGAEDVLDSSLIDLASDTGPVGLNGIAFGQGDLRYSSIDNLKMQTLLALQELGIVLGVAFMVASIFLLMIMAEKMMLSLLKKYRVSFGGKNGDEDVEADPAALVGTFKRYKN